MIKDYDQYIYSKKEWFRFFLKGAVIGGLIGYLFYDSFIGAVLLMPYGFLSVHTIKQQLILERKWQLNLQFRDALSGISASLNAGYSIENSLPKAVDDLLLVYPQEAYIIQELESIIRQLTMNQPFEEALHGFAIRSKVEDIANFSEVFITAKRTGGDMLKIIKTTEATISEKVEVKRAIRTMIAGKKYEADIMCIIPFGIILYFKLFSPGFLEPIYHNLFGIVFMTVLLIIYYFSYKLAHKIISIDI